MTARSADRAAVFVDRDGVLCRNRPDYVKSWAEFEFLPGAIEALASLARGGLRLFVATNQAVIGKRIMTRAQLDRIHDRMLDVLSGAGVPIDAVLVCPHDPADGCACRKPEPGLLVEAAKEFKIDLGRSFMIGDAQSDVEAGARAGCATVLVRTGRGEDALTNNAWGEHRPDFVADDIVDAAIWILARRAMPVDVRRANPLPGGYVGR